MKQYIGLISAATLAGCLLIGGIAFGVWHEWTVFATESPEIAWAMRFLLFALPVFVLPAYGLAIVWQRWGRTRYLDARWRVLMKRAEVQIAPLATSYHYQTHAIAGDAPALQAPALDVVKPMDAWLSWLDSQPHTLLSGKTKAGKTHTATSILSRRLRAGEMVTIIDPHSSAWLGLPTVGFVGMLPDGKPDTADLNKALIAVASEYIRRMRERDDYKSQTNQELAHTHFGRMTVLVDEANYIFDTLPTVWREFIKALASGGRKVGISLLVLGQSALIEDLGCSGGMRANFARLGLDDYTVKQLIGSDEKDGERKKALNAALIGLERPAGATIDGQVWLLDRRNLDAGSAPTGAHALIWNGNKVPGVELASRADSSISSIVPTAAEIAAIAVELRSGTPAEVAKKLDGYHPRKYAEYKKKVEYVQALIQGVTQ